MIDLKVPSPGESISEVEIGSWLCEDGSYVEKDQEVVSIESEKASLSVTAPQAGVLKIMKGNGQRVPVGAVIARIDPSGVPSKVEPGPAPQQPKEKESQTGLLEPEGHKLVKITPVAKEIMQEHNLSVDDIINGLARITKDHVIRVIKESQAETGKEPVKTEESRTGRSQDRKQISLLRKKLGERLVAVKNETAMLTTFNEIDMSAVMDLRNRHKAAFEERHKVKLGFMSFFTLACTRALKAFPEVNTQIDGDDIVSFNYVDIGIAVQTPKGLMVPILRDTDLMSLAGIETGIARLAAKARDNKISMEELQGGTFSITNGGVFGSLLSTPILNPPQPAILGMHNIVERPVALAGQVVIRPMMYVALSYDHRLIDGKDSVGFLKAVKEMIENPVKLLDPTGLAEKSLLGI